MKTLITLSIMLGLSMASASAFPWQHKTASKIVAATTVSDKTSWEKLKAALLVEIDNLEKDLDAAIADITVLKQDKDTLQKSLDDMRAWGVDQQAASQKYWDAKVTAEHETAATKVKLTETISRYHRIKLIAALVAGLFSMMMYLKSNATPSLLGSLTGLVPYTGIVQILAPFLAFAAGFAIIWFPL